MTYVSGRTRSPALDPTDSHYAMSQDTHLHFQMLAAALLSLNILADPPPGSGGTDFEDRHAAPIFWILGDYAERLLDECIEVHPRKVAA